MMTIVVKALLIQAFAEEFSDDEKFTDFFAYNDLGVPLAILLAQGHIDLRTEGEKTILETWFDLCAHVGAAPNARYTSLAELYDGDGDAEPMIDIQLSIDLNNDGHGAFKLGDAKNALALWLEASSIGVPNAMTSLIWLRMFLNDFESASTDLVGYVSRTKRWRETYDSITGDPSLGESQFGEHGNKARYNAALASYLSGDTLTATALLGVAGDGAEAEFLRKVINGVEVSDMDLNHGQIIELVKTFEDVIDTYARINEFDSTVIKPWDGRTLLDFATENLPKLKSLDVPNNESGGNASIFEPGAPGVSSLLTQIDRYKNLGAEMPIDSRMEMFRSLFEIAKDRASAETVLKNIAEGSSGSDDEAVEERLCLIRFVLNYASGTLVTQNLMPAELKEDLKHIDFNTPLLRQDAQGNWDDFAGAKSGIQIAGAELGRLIEGDLKNFKYCNVSSFDYSFTSEAIGDADVFDDFEKLIELDYLPKEMDLTEYAYFAWHDYSYPEFLLLAYANPSNEFAKPIKYEKETQWSSAYDKPSDLLNFVPSGLVEILSFRPRLLLLLASTKVADHFEELVDHWINLFPVLECSQLSKNEERRDAVLSSYVSEVNEGGATSRLDEYLDDESELSKFFMIASSCLYTNNSLLLDELSKIDDETTRICLLLNPNAKMPEGTEDFNLIEDFSEEFQPSIIGDGFDGPSEFLAEILRISSECRDGEFVANLKSFEVGI
jgi:hypothetical protein